eukprot:13348366-Ditylum_brightwellii.AAC.1
MGNLEKLINWRIPLNHAIWNKPCKSPESQFNMVEMLLGGKGLQHWQQYKSHATGLLILVVLNEDEDESSREKEEDGKAKKKKEEGQSSASAASPAGLTKDTYSSSMRKLMCYYFVNHQYAVMTQKHYL